MTELGEDLLAAFGAGWESSAPLPLQRLSGLSATDLVSLEAVWPTLPASVRRRLMEHLVETAESDFEMDFGAVYRVALGDDDPDVRKAAVEGLWEDEDVRLVPYLVSRLLYDDSPAVRSAAATSLGRFVLLGELDKIRPGPCGAAYEALLACCSRERETEVWRRAVESLAYVSNEDVDSLIEAAYAEPDEGMRASALFAMGRNGDERWNRFVRRELFSPNPELRFEGARACGELSLAEAVADLEELIEDVDQEVREAAIWSLGQIGGDRARQVVEHLALSEDDATRGAAESALDELDFLGGELTHILDRLSGDVGP